MYNNISGVTIESLRKHCAMIHYFGLGFIQIKLSSVYRMHFYTQELPAIIGDEDIHNHRYNFRSLILFGRLTQENFSLIDGDTHTLETETCKANMPSNTPSTLCSIKKILTQHFVPGSSYEIFHETFHRIRSDQAITILERGPILKNLSEVIRPINAPKVCPFSKIIPETELWTIIERILQGAHGT